MLEKFELWKTTRTNARWRFTLEVLKLFRPGIIRPIEGAYRMNHLGILKNYLKVGWRNMRSQKLYTAINVGGLSLGIAAFILIFMYVRHELSYDKFFPNSGNIYRAYQQQTFNPFMGSDYFAVMPAGFAGTLMHNFPEVTAATSLQTPTKTISKGESYYLEKGVSADQHFFEVLPFEFLRGDATTALANPDNVVVTESLAAKLFGAEDPMDQVISLDSRAMRISGVIKDLPTTSSLQFSHVWSLEADPWYLDDKAKEKWEGNAFYTFFTVANGADVDGLQRKMPALLKEKWAYDEYPEYLFQPMTNMHLQTGVNFDLGSRGNPGQLTLFSLIAGLILLLACINYMNLAIARSIRRAKEVGLRKVIGAHQWQLAFQFLGESIFVTLIALALAGLLLPVLLPYFGHMVDRAITLQPSDLVLLAPGLLALVLLVGLLSGSYPAIFMSSLTPVIVLKGKVTSPGKGLRLQRWLIVGQYTVSIAMIICSLVIYRQFRFISEKELGFDRDHVVTFRSYDGKIQEKFEALKAEWMSNPQVIAVVKSQNLPTNVEQSTVVSLHEEGGDADFSHTIYQLRTDDNFLKVYGMELVAGRNLSPDYAFDKSAGNCLINEAACRAFGWSVEEAVGKSFASGWEGKKTVVGVLKDFHMHSMHMAIAPLLVEMRDNFRYISVKIRPGDLAGTVGMLEDAFKKHSSYPYDYEFLDENFDRLYKSDRRQAEIFGFFTVVALLIASLGLFGLAAFSTQQRAREVGIRKVLGASVAQIVSLFASRFIRMVVVGYALALPVAWVVVNDWLEAYAYRVDLRWWMFALPGVAALIVAFLTIFAQSVKAAMANPTNSLRAE